MWSPVGSDRLVGRGRDLNDDAIVDEILYSLQDAQGNVTALATTSGAIVERVVQDPYGDHLVLSPSYEFQHAGDHAWNYFHQGLRLDMSEALYDNRYRFYSPTLMRFLQMDPIGFAAGDPNLYRYVGNGPVSGSDPLGLQDFRRTPPLVVANMADFRCAQCHGDLRGNFKNIAAGGMYSWDDLGSAQRMILELQSTYKAGPVERGATRAINGVTLFPLHLGGSLLESGLQLSNEGASPAAATAAAPFLTIAKTVQSLGISLYQISTGNGSAEDYVDVGMAAAIPFLPKLVGRTAKAPIKGGSYQAVRKANVGGDVYHTPAKSATQLDPNTLPAIHMSTADHAMTASFGNTRAARAYRQQQRAFVDRGRWMDAIQMDINDLSAKFGPKYGDGIRQMVRYARTIGLIP